MTKRKKRILIIAIASAVCSLVALAFYAHWPKEKDELIISRETTYLTEPVLPDGTIDYIAAVNQRMAEGVTPENNAAILLCQVAGPEWLLKSYHVGTEKDKQALLNRFGRHMDWEPTFPEEKRYIGFKAFLQRQAPEGEEDDPPIPLGIQAVLDEPFSEDFQGTMYIPFTSEDQPDVAAWLEANRVPLDTLVAASKQEKLFLPLICMGEARYYLAAQTPWHIEFRPFSNDLLTRALLHVGEDRPKEAWEDIQTVFNLSELLQTQTDLVDFLMCLSLRNRAYNTISSAAASGKVSPPMAEQWQGRLAGMSEPYPPAKYIEQIRLAALSAANLLYRTGQGISEDMEGVSPEKFAELIDWNRMYRRINDWYDLYEHVLATTPPEEELKISRVTNEEYQRIKDKREGLKYKLLLCPFLGRLGRPMFTDLVYGELMCMLMPSISKTVVLHARDARYRRLAIIALGLSRYKSENGEYPASLVALSPQYLPEKITAEELQDESMFYELIEEGKGYRLFDKKLVDDYDAQPMECWESQMYGDPWPGDEKE